MIISEIEYHVLLPFIDGDPITPAMEADMMPAVREQLELFKASLCELDREPDYLYFRFSASPEHTPAGQVEAVKDCITKLLLERSDMEGYKEIFMPQMYISSGAKPDEEITEDFLRLCRDGV